MDFIAYSLPLLAQIKSVDVVSVLYIGIIGLEPVGVIENKYLVAFSFRVKLAEGFFY